ncbi:sister chromatid cohesion protein PDS5 homolog A-A-like [Pollicipes pollicipes]|uniref:sister chromatid cohesion protein PDS5 homolog A-A-like n=1 Tax=Pollicipes pollicipes TaxID=41117 RepID=UPI001884DE99|nr:sister chromatid cohesion protein PDS5 homolog A-A-like [Pollicipes pollicipes]XP_037070381.1 sister chromatid cohesion protein PDS5 homolog A-A-like [Pollicipes pollicipes]
MSRAGSSTESAAILYPPGCREITEDLGPDELIRRLKTLAHTYQSMVQDDGAYQEYLPLAKHIADDYFREYPSKDVQLLVACCIADVLRVYAPEAPYKDPAQVKTIFMFLIKQLAGLKDPKDPAFKRYFYLLENLAYVKSFNMCLELEDSNEIICSLFSLTFKIVNDEHSGKVKSFMLDVLCPLIYESDVVSNELMDIILMNVVEPAKSTRRNAYHLAKELIMKCSDTLEPYIQAFFNHVLILGKEEKKLGISRKVYDLIYELNHICPTVLLAVVPQLEFKLKSTEEDERFHAVSLLARMFSEQESNLAMHHRQLWLAFLGRFNDISVKIRTKCVQYSMHFLLNHPELRSDITDTLKFRQHDSDEAVRYEVVMAIVATAKRDFSIVSESEALLNFVKERTLDKKFKIRKEAMCGLAMIYRKYLSNPDVPEATRTAITWIKDKILHGYYMTSLDDRLLVERIVNTCLVPFTLPPEERMKKLYYLFATLDENATKAFIEMQKQQLAVRKTVQELLELHRAPPSDEREKEKALRISYLSKFLPDPVKAQEFIRKFSVHLAQEEALLLLMETVINPTVSCRESVDSVNMVLKRLGQPVMTNLYYNTIKQLLERVSSVMIDHDALLALVQMVEEAVRDPGSAQDLNIEPGAAVGRGLRLLFVMSYVQAAQFLHADILAVLLEMLQTNDDVVTPKVLGVLHFVGKYRPLAAEFPELADALVPVCQQLATTGTPKQAKHAIRCLYVNVTDNQEGVFTEILERLKAQLELGHEHYRTSIVSLGHIALYLSGKFPIQIKNIVSRKIVKDLLMKDLTDSGELDDEWCEEDALPEGIRCKIEGMKLMARWLIGLKDDVISAQKTFRMLVAFIIHRGDLLEEGRVNKPEAAWLRYAAGAAMLKICEQKGVGDQFTADQFYSLSLLMADECAQVRERFAAKLHKGLSRGIPHKCLPLDFMGMYALAGQEPDKRLKSIVRSYMSADILKRRDVIKSLLLTGGSERAADQLPHIMPDYMLVFAVPILAHDPDFTSYEDVEYLTKIRSCLWFILEPLITKNDNYCFGFYKALVERMKNHLDAVRSEEEAANQKLWAVCDLAMGLLLTKTTNFEMREFPSEPRIPPMYFRKPADPNFVNGKLYLPIEMQHLGKRGGIISSTYSHSMINKRIQLAQQIRASKADGPKELTVIVQEAGGAVSVPAEGAAAESDEEAAPAATASSQRLIRDPPATYSRRATHERDRNDDSVDSAGGADVSASERSSVADSPSKQEKITNYFKKAPKGASPTGSPTQRSSRGRADQPTAEEEAARTNQRTSSRSTRTRGAEKAAEQETDSGSRPVNGSQKQGSTETEAEPTSRAGKRKTAPAAVVKTEPGEPSRKSARHSSQDDSASSTKSTRSTRSKK